MSEESHDPEFEVVKRGSLSVFAANCLCFAWSPHDYQGPVNWETGGWESGDAYRPQVFDVTGCERVTLQVTSPNVYWRHGDNDQWRSTAAGRDVSVWTDPRYFSDAYRSAHIQQESPQRLNALVGMVGGDFNHPPTLEVPRKIEYVGLNGFLIVPDETTTTLYLGMHDGFEWSTNYNENGDPMEVAITLEKRRTS